MAKQRLHSFQPSHIGSEIYFKSRTDEKRKEMVLHFGYTQLLRLAHMDHSANTSAVASLSQKCPIPGSKDDEALAHS
jgi:hypothetical protein